jgi:hypothetical protein
MKSTRTIETGLFVALACCLLYGTWILPYKFPPQGFVIGASNEVGFNNTSSFLAYLICVSALALLASRFFSAPQVRVSDAAREPSGFAAAVAAVVVVGHVLLFTVLYTYKGRFVFAEGLYFQSLLYRMSIGEIPYLNFSFYYGPLMLYPAFWLSKLVGLDLGYGIWFIATYAAGLVFLYIVIRACMPDERSRAFWFVLLALGLFNPLTGLNETFTRYLFPSLVFLSTVAYFQHGGARRAILASALLAAAVTYSFEVAALSVAAVGLLWIAFVIVANPSVRAVTSRAVVLLTTGGVCSIAFFLLVDPSGSALRDYPAIARSYSAGAHNVPIYPNLPFIALAGITIATLGALLRATLHEGNQIVAMSALAYGLLALIAQRAAFGAAEPSHFAYFGVPMFCLALFLTTLMPAGHTARSWLAAALVLGIMLPMQYYHAMEFVPFFTQRLHQSQAQALSTDSGGPAEPARNLDADLHELVSTVGADRPYVMYEMEYSSLPVYRDFKLRYPSYFTMLITARDDDGIQRVIRDVRDKQAIVVARKQDMAGLERTHRSTGIWHVLDVLSGAHTAGSDLNELLLKSRTRLTQPFLIFVETEYAPLYDRGGLVAYGPRRN